MIIAKTINYKAGNEGTLMQHYSTEASGVAHYHMVVCQASSAAAHRSIALEHPS